MSFLVKWLGADKNSWEPWKGLRTNMALHNYLRQHKMSGLISPRFKKRGDQVVNPRSPRVIRKELTRSTSPDKVQGLNQSALPKEVLQQIVDENVSEGDGKKHQTRLTTGILKRTCVSEGEAPDGHTVKRKKVKSDL